MLTYCASAEHAIPNLTHDSSDLHVLRRNYGAVRDLQLLNETGQLHAEKAGVGASTPSLATRLSITCRSRISLFACNSLLVSIKSGLNCSLGFRHEIVDKYPGWSMPETAASGPVHPSDPGPPAKKKVLLSRNQRAFRAQLVVPALVTGTFSNPRLRPTCSNLPR